jgi:ribosomal protein S18 acetylase RimI-like enzyme
VTDVLIRPATPEDRPFIADSWLRSFRRSPWAVRVWGQPDRGERDRVYYSRYGHAGWVDTLLTSFPGQFSVACLESDPSFVMGFSVFDGRTILLHYVYVKAAFRRNGIGRQLCPQSSYVVTAETPKWQAFAKKHGIAYEYTHPYGRNER